MSRRIGSALLLACALLPACSNSTGGQLITQPFLVGGCNVCTNNSVPRTDASQPFTFTNSSGWTVTLTEAFVDLGPFYFNVYPPNTTSFMSGTIIMEVPTLVVVNALDPTLFSVGGGVSGESGTSVSVQIGLLSPDITVQTLAPGLANLINGNGNGGVGFVEGTATYGTTTVAFSGPILISQSLASPAMPLPYWQRVPGAGVNLDFTSATQTLEMRVDPTHWFDNVEFIASEFGAPAVPDAGPLPSGDPCATDNGGCDRNATCTDTDGGISCACNPSYVGDGGMCMLNANGWTVGTTFNQDLAQGLETGEGAYLFTLVEGTVFVDGGVPPALYSTIPDGGI